MATATVHKASESEGPGTHQVKSAPLVKVVLPRVTQWCGMREFAIEDPDGYAITFAEHVQK
jgi:hypothetical protein